MAQTNQSGFRKSIGERRKELPGERSMAILSDYEYMRGAVDRTVKVLHREGQGRIERAASTAKGGYRDMGKASRSSGRR